MIGDTIKTFYIAGCLCLEATLRLKHLTHNFIFIKNTDLQAYIFESSPDFEN